MNISVRQIAFTGSDEKTRMVGWLYVPAGELRGVVQIVHGMAEHMGRYHEFMRFLAQNGFAAAGFDQLGHGRSADGQYGFFAERDGWRLLVEDQHRFHKILHTEIPGLWRSILFGHSMGSFVARLYASRHPRTISGMILSGTARGGVRADFGMQAAAISVRRNGPAHIDHVIDQLAFGGFNERCLPAKTRYDWLTREAQAVRRYLDDPACGFIFTNSAFGDLFALISGANHGRTFEAFAKDVPILLVSGDQDPVGEYGKGPIRVQARYRKAGVRDVQLALYAGGRHEMLQESNREQVCDDILAWLCEHFTVQVEPIFPEGR